MHVRFASCLSLLLLGILCGTGAHVVAQIPDVPGWKIKAFDEFEGTSLNTTLWEKMNRKDSFNDEKQYYHPNQVAVADGNLQITAINVPRDGKAYQSGLITSKALYGPGRYEARMNLPTTQGMWPAFWMNANQVAWPKGGEIDILENRGRQPTLVSSAYHWQVSQSQPCCDGHRYEFDEYVHLGPAEENFHNAFHTYAVEWEETQLRFYVDGNLYHTLTESAAMPIYETAKSIIINLAVGGQFGGDPNGTTVFPQTLLVDYVRMWEKQTGLVGDYNGDAIVDAADYTVWRNSQGQTGIGLPADGSGNGTVGQEDFEVWKANFSGELPGVGASTSNNVPEPAAISLSIGALLAFLQRVRGGEIGCRR